MSSIRSAHLRLPGLTLVMAGLLVMFATTASAQTPEEQRLEETKARIDEVRAELEAAEGQQSHDARALAEAEQRLAIVTEALIAAEQAVARQEQAVADAEAELQRLEAAAARQKSAMSARVVDLYKQGSTMEFTPLFTADDPTEALAQTAVVNIVAKADRRALEQVTVTQKQIDQQRQRLEIERETLDRVAQERAEVVATAEIIRQDRSIALAETTSRVNELEAQERHLESESAELAALARRAARVAAAARAAETTQTFTPAPTADKAVSGGWTWPASGPVTSEFGWRWGRAHEGIDIGAPTGAAIWAAAPGTVSFAGSMSGYGNMMLIDHGGGITTAYAHQTGFAVGVGTQVSAGQQIGYVGSTGNSTGPHLHFEVRVNGAPVNPRSYLP